MYDVALSFAGEDRTVALKLAQQAEAIGLSVFYDQFEQSKLWGKDLAVYLDTVYRKDALCCIVLISDAYLRKLWTRHEIRSAFARAMEQGDDYLLPVRLDDTDLPGLPPTVGYLDARTTTPEEIVRLLGEKLGVEMDSTLRQNECLNALGRIGIPCSIFLIDRRYTLFPDDGWEMRLAVSFGPNISDTFGPVLMPPRMGGKYILGLHCVYTLSSSQLGVCDMWYDARPYGEEMSNLSAVKAATGWLNEFDDEEYKYHANDDAVPVEPMVVLRSRPLLLPDLELLIPQ